MAETFVKGMDGGFSPDSLIPSVFLEQREKQLNLAYTL
jgi:hypothetical protein